MQILSTKIRIVFLLLLWINTVNAVRYIKVTATGTGDGTSWTNAAGLNDIQAMISADSAATAGTTANGEVRFASGKYFIPAVIELPGGVNLTGGWSVDGTRDSWKNPTIIDGQFERRLIQTRDNPNLFSKMTLVDGFILQRGKNSYGSAVAINTGVILKNCIIRNNQGGEYGAAVFLKQSRKYAPGSFGYVSGALINCMVVNNTASKTVGTSYNSAAIFVGDSSPFSLVNCLIANNLCADVLNGTSYGVGGLYISGANSSLANAQVLNTVFYNNSGSAANNVKVNNSLSMPNIYNNWFSDASIPFVNAGNTLTTLKSKGNLSGADVSNPGFEAAATKVGCQVTNADTTAIYYAGWSLSASSALQNKGVERDILYPYSTYNNGTNALYSTVTTDIMGNSRIANTLPDIGVSEFTPVTLTVQSANATAGTVSASGQVCKNALVTVTATPNPGWGFTAWTNPQTSEILSRKSVYSFNIGADITLVASFKHISTVTMTTPSFARTANSIDLTWSAPDFNGDLTYKIVDASNNILRNNIQGLHTCFSNLTANASYSYKLIAVSGGQDSQPGAAVTAETRASSGVNFQLINDFENSNNGWLAQYNSTFTWGAANPTNSATNSSAKCVKVVLAQNGNNDAGMQNKKERIDIGPNAPYRYLHVKFKRNAENGILQLSLSGRSDTVQTSSSPSLDIDYTSKMIDGNWYDYVFDLKLASYTNQSHFGLSFRPNKTLYDNAMSTISYFDDVFLSNDPTPLNSNLSTVTLSVSSADVAKGTVSGGGLCLKNQLTKVVATAKAPYHFYNWTENGNEVSADSVYTFTPVAARNLVANFQQYYTVTVNSNNILKGSVSGGGNFNLNQNATVNAVPQSGYSFAGWYEKDKLVSSLASYSFTVQADRRLTARFIQPVTVNVSANNAAFGTVTGGGVYDQSETVTITANPKAGYVFQNWTENGQVLSSSTTYSFNSVSTRNIVAIFAPLSSDVDNYNYSLGTITIGAKYKFTADDVLVETAKAIKEMGSNMIKITLNLDYDNNNYSDYVALIRDNSAYRTVFDMSFNRYFFWCQGKEYTLTDDYYSEDERVNDSINIFNLTKYLLTQYNNSGKTFYLGQWEGDWTFTRLDAAFVPSDQRIQAFIRWYNTRQNAIERAKALTPHSNVEIFHYAEVNRCVDARDKGLRRLINTVIPYVNVDYISYSSYDFQKFSQSDYNALLDYVESKLPVKAGLPPGKRVFIGEMGNCFSECNYSNEVHDARNRTLIVKALRWGCPFVLYWEMYNNNILEDGSPMGWWLINDKNEKTHLYYTFANLYKNGKQWLSSYKQQYGYLPAQTEYQAWAIAQLENAPQLPDITTIPTVVRDGVKFRINQTQDGFIIDSDTIMSTLNGLVKLIALDGKVIHSQSIKSFPIKVPVPNKGVYILTIQNNEFNFSEKLIRY